MIIILKYWKHLLLISLLVVASYIVYNKIYDSGYSKATAEYNLKIEDYNKKLDSRINNIEIASSTIVNTLSTQRDITKKDLSNILYAVKNKPPYIIDKTGKCAPSIDFIDTYNKAIDRVNKK